MIFPVVFALACASAITGSPVPADNNATDFSILSSRAALFAKDSCGQASDGHATNGGWVLRASFENQARRFCTKYEGKEVREFQSIVSEHYPATRTGMGPGVLVFVIRNLMQATPYRVDFMECLDTIRTVLDPNSPCYGKKHDDTKGGYKGIREGTIQIGSELYQA